MASEEQVALLKKSVTAWNQWRKMNADESIDLSGANLIGALLNGADLTGANLREANFSGALLRGALFCEADLLGTQFRKADLSEANLSGAHLIQANLRESTLTGANLSSAALVRANLREANLNSANLKGVNLSEANLTNASLVETNLEGANLTSCRIYGISAWNVTLKDSIQTDLVITREGESLIAVDDVEVAQFIYLLLNNQKLKKVLDTLTSKSVLLLGRFTDERKRILDSIRDELRRRGYMPILFDFEPSPSRDLTETVTLLARMARFVIADLTDPKSIPQELTSIIPDLPSVPIQPIILASQREYAMYSHWRRYPWVLDIQPYNGIDDLMDSLAIKVIAPAEQYLEKSKANISE